MRAGGIDIWRYVLSDRKRSLRRRLSARVGFGAALLATGATLIVSLFTAVAGTPAATGAAVTNPVVVTTATSTTSVASPASLATCGGTISRDAQGDNWYDYTFSCSPAVTSTSATGNVLGFALLATRPNIDGVLFDQSNIQSNVSPAIYTPSGAAEDETVYCNTAAPSDGFDCDTENVISQTTATSSTPTAGNPCYAPSSALYFTNYGCIPSGDSVEGSFQLSAGYCPYYPTGAKAGTPAIPRATVNVIVTDTTGAVDGPFELIPSFKCNKVAAVKPGPKTVTTKKKKSKAKAAKSKSAKAKN